VLVLGATARRGLDFGDREDEIANVATTFPECDAIEYCRGQLAALSYVSATAAREVHVLRLRNTFERARIAHKLRYALNVISLMREAQELGGGYWFPTPLRVVPVDGKTILVGPATTKELKRHFLDVTRAGYARVFLPLSTQELPIQELDNWLGLSIRDTVAWAGAEIERARSGMGPTIPSGNIEFFSVGTAWSAVGSIARPKWTNDARLSFSGERGVVLCRERLGQASFRYFFGLVKHARLVAEFPAPRDTARIQFGLAALTGKPCTVTVFPRDGESVFHIPIGLPRAERQLTLAVGIRDISSAGRVYRIRGEAFASIVAAKLRDLGCEVRENRV